MINSKRCLVLNASWFPIAIRTLTSSLKKLCVGKATIIAPIEDNGSTLYQEFTFEQWIQKSLDKDKPFLRTQYLRVEIPEIIKVKYSRMHIQKLPLKASNVFARDGHKCWYCGSQENLTIDHIIPLCRGGQTSWKNLITCCHSCNNIKDDMDAKKFCEIKKVNVPKPVNVGSLPWLRELGRNYPNSWKKWLNFS